MTEWKPLAVRISLFPPRSSSTPSGHEVFKSLMGFEPDSFRKDPNPLLPTVAEGNRNGISVNCTTLPGRIDLNLSSAPSRTTPREVFPLFDDMSQINGELKRIIEAIGHAPTLAAMSRMALVIQVVNLCPDVPSANKNVTNIMPQKYRVQLTDEEEFAFQVNQPFMSSSVDRTRMNSIIKWSVERFQFLSISIPMGGNPASASADISRTQTTNEFIAGSLAVEINNTPMPNLILTEAHQSSLLLEALDRIAHVQQDVGLRN